MGGQDASTCSEQAVPLIPSQLLCDYLDPIGQDRADREVMTSRSAPHGVDLPQVLSGAMNVDDHSGEKATAHVGQ